jgi:hypothetical protein
MSGFFWSFTARLVSSKTGPKVNLKKILKLEFLNPLDIVANDARYQFLSHENYEKAQIRAQFEFI